MQIIARRTLKRFWSRHPPAEQPLRNWFATVSGAEWKRPADAKAMFGANVDFVGDNRPIFDIGGNKYRLVMHVSYLYRRVLVKFVGTHKDYDRINPENV